MDLVAKLKMGREQRLGYLLEPQQSLDRHMSMVGMALCARAKRNKRNQRWDLLEQQHKPLYSEVLFSLVLLKL